MHTTSETFESLRNDFPVLKRKVRDGKKLVYLDNAATTQKPIQVIDAISDYYKNNNSSHLSHRLPTNHTLFLNMII